MLTGVGGGGMLTGRHNRAVAVPDQSEGGAVTDRILAYGKARAVSMTKCTVWCQQHFYADTLNLSGHSHAYTPILRVYTTLAYPTPNVALCPESPNFLDSEEDLF